MRAVVSLRKCRDYASVADAIDRVLADLGGLERFVRPGQTVLLKPNLLSNHAPDEAVTTHPEVVRALIRRIKKAGAEPVVADSPSNTIALVRVWERTGFAAMCAQEATPLINLEHAGAERFEVDGFRFAVARPILTADCLISVPKVKTHVLTVFTGAVKNMYGSVAGFQKTALHLQYPRLDQFGDLIAAVYGRVKPALSIADGIVAMDGNGPSGGRPYSLDVVGGSADAAALDVALCRLVNIPAADVPYFRKIAADRSGETDWARIELRGEPLSALQSGGFRVPQTVPLNRIPRWISRRVAPLIWVRPRFTDRCEYCGKCARACPAGALTAAPQLKPRLDSRRCIACCCCHEVCPAKAIEMRPSPLLWIARRGRAFR